MKVQACSRLDCRCEWPSLPNTSTRSKHCRRGHAVSLPPSRWSSTSSRNLVALDPVFLTRSTQSSLESSALASPKDFYHEEVTESGKVRIRPLRSSDVVDVANLLVQTFSEALGYAGAFKWLLRKEITWYLEDCLKMGPEQVVLVAMLEPVEGAADVTSESSYSRPMFQTFSLSSEEVPSIKTPERENYGSVPEKKTVSSVFMDFRSEIDSNQLRSVSRDRQTDPSKPETMPIESEGSDEIRDEENTSDTAKQAPGRENVEAQQQLLGTLELSLNDKGRSFYFLLNPPSDAAYICNMAVHPDFRRQGHASRLLKAAERIVHESPAKEIYLHLIVDDEAAGCLYRHFGYRVEDTAPGLVRLFGQEQKHLMRKCIE